MPEKTIHQVSAQAREFYQKGATAVERNNMEPAFHYLTECLALEPAFFQARQLLRVAQIKKTKSAGTISKLFGSAAGSPALVKAMATVSKDPSGAMVAAEKSLCSNPYNLQALRLLSNAAEKMDLLKTALFAMETAREKYPDEVDVLLELARLYRCNGQNDKARDVYDRILAIDPANAEAFKGMKDATADEAMVKGKWDETGSYRDKIKDVAEAQQLENAGKIFKDTDVVHAQMRDVFALTQEQPENPSHWKKLGDLAASIEEFDYSIQCYQHAFELTSGADGAIEKLVAETKLRRVSKGILEKEAQLVSDPNNEVLRQEIEGLKVEREKSVMEECEGRAKRYPNDLDIRFELARIYHRNGMIDKAISEFQAASNNPKNKVACIFWLGRCFREKGMLDLAVQRFKSAVEQLIGMDGLKKDILYHLGSTYEQMKKENEAMEQYKLIYDVDVNYLDVGKKIEAYYLRQSQNS